MERSRSAMQRRPPSNDPAAVHQSKAADDREARAVDGRSLGKRPRACASAARRSHCRSVVAVAEAERREVLSQFVAVSKAPAVDDLSASRRSATLRSVHDLAGQRKPVTLLAKSQRSDAGGTRASEPPASRVGDRAGGGSRMSLRPSLRTRPCRDACGVQGEPRSRAPLVRRSSLRERRGDHSRQRPRERATAIQAWRFGLQTRTRDLALTAAAASAPSSGTGRTGTRMRGLRSID
jgi:hypothetical protein